MTEGFKAKQDVQCGKKTCRLTSSITETNKPHGPIEYSGMISCDTCGVDWAYERIECREAKIERLGFRQAV